MSKDLIDHAEEAFQSLVSIDEELEDSNKKFKKESLELFEKYEKSREPLYSKRRDVISGIHGFWGNALQAHPIISRVIELPEDDEIMSLLLDIWVERPSSGARRVIFTFDATKNPYFSNETLSKEWKIDLETGSVAYVHPCEIEWKEGKNLNTVDTNNSNNDILGSEEAAGSSISNKRSRDQVEKSTSFFVWFTEDDTELGELIANDLFPNAISYFTAEDEESAEDLSENGLENLEGIEDELLNEDEDVCEDTEDQEGNLCEDSEEQDEEA